VLFRSVFCFFPPHLFYLFLNSFSQESEPSDKEEEEEVANEETKPQPKAKVRNTTSIPHRAELSVIPIRSVLFLFFSHFLFIFEFILPGVGVKG
jgi:hypothetical protein